jgi:hypothetical protein
MISGLIACDVYRIEPVDPYSDDYAETVSRNVQEQGPMPDPPSRTRSGAQRDDRSVHASTGRAGAKVPVPEELHFA